MGSKKKEKLNEAIQLDKTIQQNHVFYPIESAPVQVFEEKSVYEEYGTTSLKTFESFYDENIKNVKFLLPGLKEADYLKKIMIMWSFSEENPTNK